MDVSVTIRAGREADFDALIELWERSARSTHSFVDEDEVAHHRPRVRDLLLPSMDVWIAEQDGVDVGFIGARGTDVELLYVDPAAQGRGLGRVLLEHVVGSGPGTVQVFADNVTGASFYRSQGFTESGRHSIRVAGQTFDVLHLSREGR